jgi:hypothetical protein
MSTKEAADELQAGFWRRAKTGGLDVRRIVDGNRDDRQHADFGPLYRNDCERFREDGRIRAREFDASADSTHGGEPERIRVLVVIDAGLTLMGLVRLVVTVNRAVVVGFRAMHVLRRQQQPQHRGQSQQQYDRVLPGVSFHHGWIMSAK